MSELVQREKVQHNFANYAQVSRLEYIFALVYAQEASPRIKSFTCAPSDISYNVQYWLHIDNLSGFGVTSPDELGNCELVGLFSLVYGRGNTMNNLAVRLGATLLNCYADPGLIEFYARNGWSEYNREPNWNGPSFPDVVYLEYTGAPLRELA